MNKKETRTFLYYVLTTCILYIKNNCVIIFHISINYNIKNIIYLNIFGLRFTTCSTDSLDGCVKINISSVFRNAAFSNPVAKCERDGNRLAEW